MISRRSFLAGGVLLAGAVGQARAVRVTPTTRHVTLLVGAAPGTGFDAAARAFVPFLSRHTAGTEISVRNVAGEGGMNAIRALMDAQPNGLTLGWLTSPTLPARIVDRGGDDPIMSRLRLLGAIEREPVAFVSPVATPLDSVQDMIQRASADQDAIPLGTPPPGSPPHLAVLRLQVLAQTRLNIVTFPSAAAARQAVISGNVSAAALALSDVIAALREDKLVGLGIAARKRTDVLPDVPVLEEAGVPLSAIIRRGLAAPASLNDDMVARLSEALRSITADPEFQALASASGFRSSWMDGPTWTVQVENERADLAKLWATDPWLPSSGG